MKTSIFDMNLVLPPLVEMSEVVKDMPAAFTNPGDRDWWNVCDLTTQENTMKTSIFDMNFVLPPLVEMTEVVKDMPLHSALTFKLCDPMCWDVFG